jgi:hypothetical protein
MANPTGAAPPARGYRDAGIGAITGSAFATHVLNGVKSYITVSQHDAVVWTPSIQLALGQLLPSPLVAVDYNANATNNTARAGLMYFTYNTGAKMSVTMPTLYRAGHSITMRAPFDLFTDVSAWYRYN